MLHKFVPFVENLLTTKLIFNFFFDLMEVVNSCAPLSLLSLITKAFYIKKSCPYTHEQNNVAVRKHHHIVETTLTLLFHASISLEIWFHAFATATFLINQMPMATLNFLSPFEKLFGRPPDYKHLKSLGAHAFLSSNLITNVSLNPKLHLMSFLAVHLTIRVTYAIIYNPKRP